jgi:DNA-binding transcriptional LysR family regulator
MEYRYMELRQFAQFIAVAEELNFRRAAERLHMAQPPLTVAIKKIEDELGVVLLERSNRVARLTAAGEVFLEEARRTLLQAESAVRAAKRAGAGIIGSLRVTFVASASRDLLPRILPAFRKHHAEVELELVEATTAQQVKALLDGQADVGFLVPPVRDAGGLTIEMLKEDRLVAALPEGHVLAKRKQLTLADLANEPWIMFPARQGPGLHARIMASCVQAGFTPNIRQEAIQMGTIVNLVGCGIGVALVPSSLASPANNNVSFTIISGPGTPVGYARAMVYGASSPVLAAFIKIVRSHIVTLR